MLAFSMSFMQMGLTMVFVSKNASAENTGKDPSFCFPIIFQKNIIFKFGSTVKCYGQRCKLSIQADSEFFGTVFIVQSQTKSSS